MISVLLNVHGQSHEEYSLASCNHTRCYSGVLCITTYGCTLPLITYDKAWGSMIQEFELAWMAGIIDLKGKVYQKANKTRKTKQTVLLVESKEILIIEKLGNLTGTSPEYLTDRKSPDFMRRGCVEHCPDQHIHLREEPTMPAVARWTKTGAGAAIVLYNISPYLVSNRDYFRIVEEIIIGNRVESGQGIGMINAAIKCLSDLGWD